MTLKVLITIEEKPDGSILLTSEIDRGDQPLDTELSKPMGHLCNCVGSGLRAGLEAFGESSPGLLIVQDKL